MIIELLKRVPATIYVAVGTAILTATVTLLATYFNNRANTQRLQNQMYHEQTSRRLQLRRERLEELYVSSIKWFLGVDGYFLNYMSVMNGNLTEEQAEELFHKHALSQKVDYQRLEMIIDLYFPQLKKDFECVHATFSEGKALVREYTHQPNRTNELAMNSLGSLRTLFERYRKTKQQFRNAAIEEAKSV
jgi:hypothetical protein